MSIKCAIQLQGDDGVSYYLNVVNNGEIPNSLDIEGSDVVITSTNSTKKPTNKEAIFYVYNSKGAMGEGGVVLGDSSEHPSSYIYNYLGHPIRFTVNAGKNNNTKNCPLHTDPTYISSWEQFEFTPVKDPADYPLHIPPHLTAYHIASLCGEDGPSYFLTSIENATVVNESSNPVWLGEEEITNVNFVRLDYPTGEE